MNVGIGCQRGLGLRHVRVELALLAPQFGGVLYGIGGPRARLFLRLWRGLFDADGSAADADVVALAMTMTALRCS